MKPPTDHSKSLTFPRAAIREVRAFHKRILIFKTLAPGQSAECECFCVFDACKKNIDDYEWIVAFDMNYVSAVVLRTASGCRFLPTIFA